MRLARRVLLAVLLVVVVGGGVVVFLVAQDVSRLKPQIEQAFAAATGRELTIGGPIDVRWSLNPALSVESLVLSNAPFGTQPEMARIGRAEAQFAVLPLITARRLELGRITLHDSQLWLETNSEGLGNWEFAVDEEPSDSGPDTNFSIGIAPQINVRNSAFTFRDGISGEVYQTEIADLSLAPTPDGGAELKLNLDFNKRPISSEWIFDSFEAFLNGESVPVTATLKSASVELGLKGSLGDPLRAQNIDLKLDGKADRLGDVLALFGGNAAVESSVRLSAHVAGTPKAFSVSEISARVASIRLTGALTGGVPASGPVKVSGALKSSAFDLGALLAPSGEATPAAVFTKSPLPLAALNNLVADINFSASRFIYQGLTFNNFRSPIVVRDGVLTANSVAASYRGSPLSGKFRLASLGTPTYDWTMKLAGWDLAGLMEDLKLPSRIGANMDVDVSLSGAGASLNAMAASTSGQVQVVTGPGTLRTGALNHFVPGLGAVLSPFTANADRTKLNCFASRLDFAEGVGRSHVLLLDAKDFTMSGHLVVDLPSETLRLTLLPRSTKGGVLGYATDAAGRIQVGGSLWAPTIMEKSDSEQVTDLALGILGAMTRGKGRAAPAASAIDENVCLTALDKAKASQVAPEAQNRQNEDEQETEALPEPGGPEDLIRGLRGLGELLGLPDEMGLPEEN